MEGEQVEMIQAIGRAVDYIEKNILTDLTSEAIASQAHMSSFQFQRIFSILCGVTLGEYIRNRRLSLAAEEIKSTNAKIIDTALRYNYETHEGFSRAFIRFHGISPTAARSLGETKSFAPLTIDSIRKGIDVVQERITQRGYTVGHVGPVYLTPDMDKTAKWFEDVLGWYAGVETRDENGNAAYGCAMPFDGKLVHLGVTNFNGLFLLPGDTPQSQIAMMSVKGIDNLHRHVRKNNWDKITEVAMQPWGARSCRVTTIDGCVLQFFEGV